MSGLGGTISEVIVDMASSPDVPPAESQVGGRKTPLCEDRPKISDGEEDVEEEEDEEEEEEEEMMARSAHLEPSTLPWPGDKDKWPQAVSSDAVWSEKGTSEPEEKDTGISGGSEDLSERRSLASDCKSKDKWRESMPEGERWRLDEIEVQRDDKGDGSQADDEDEGDDDEDDDDESQWMLEKPTLGFTPKVTIVRLSSKKLLDESHLYIEKDPEKEPQMEPDSAMQYYPEWTQEDDKYYLCDQNSVGKLGLILSLLAAAVFFPLLVWGGYELLPFDPPKLPSTPLRVIYTLRCSFFAILPILLGVLVQGLARLRFSELKPLYQNSMLNKEVAVHWHYVNESLGLFLFYFLQLAVMATYVSQELVKLVPLLTIIFVFGRLIYWLCLSLGSSIRGLGFGFSFFPILVMLVANFYFICSSVGQEVVFAVAPPTVAPPPQQRWWG